MQPARWRFAIYRQLLQKNMADLGLGLGKLNFSMIFQSYYFCKQSEVLLCRKVVFHVLKTSPSLFLQAFSCVFWLTWMKMSCRSPGGLFCGRGHPAINSSAESHVAAESRLPGAVFLCRGSLCSSAVLCRTCSAILIFQLSNH